MLTDADFLTWLQSRSIKVPKPKTQDPFDDSTYNSIVNGTIIASIILELLDKAPYIGASADIKAKLKAMPADTKFVTKSKNWEVLNKAMHLLGLEISEEARAMIIAGVTEEIVKMLWAIRELDDKVSTRGSLTNHKDPQHKIRLGPDGALFLDSVEGGKLLPETTYCLEFLLVSMSRAFSIKPKQAAILLTRNGRYLAKILCKGLRKQFIPIIEWLDAMKTHSSHLKGLLVNERRNNAVPFVCDALLPGLLSKNEGVVGKVSELLTLISSEEEIRNETWQWFKDERTCINSAIVAYSRYPGLSQKIIDLLFSFGKLRMECMLKELLPSCFAKSADYIAYVIEFYDYLMRLPNINLELLKTSLIEFWVGTGITVLEEDPSASALPINELMCLLWANFPHRVDENSANAIFTHLKKMLRDKRLTVRMRCVSMMFYLLDTFAAKKHLYAPVIYKTLASYYIEAYNSFPIRQTLIFNFDLLFVKYQAMPLNLLVDPVFKQLKLTNCRKAEVNDIDLINAMARHPQLDSKTAVVLLNMLGLIFMNVPIFAKACSLPMISICRGFGHSENVQDYLVRFCKLGIQEICIEQIGKRKLSSTPREQKTFSRNATVERTLKLTPSSSVSEFSRALTSSRNGAFVLNFAKDLFDLKHKPLSEKLQKALLDMNKEFNKKTGEDFQPVKKLLSRYGDPGTLAVLYSSLLSPSAALVPLYDSKTHQIKIRGEIKNVRQKWLMTTEAQKKRAEHEEQTRKRQLMMIQKNLELRNIKLGIPMEDDEKPLIFPFNSQLSEEQDIELFEIVPEHHTHLQQVLRRYKRAINFIFKAYAKPKAELTTEKVLSEGQYWLLLKDQGLTSDMINNEEFRKLMKKFCVKSGRTNSTLEFRGFVEMLVQVACLVFFKDQYGLADFPPDIAFSKLFEVFNRSFTARGESLAIFEEAESELIRTMNAKLAENPDFELPSNFMRCEEVRHDVAYELPSINIAESVASALEILDEVMVRALNIHLLRPVIKDDICYYAKKNPLKAGITQANLDIPLEFNQALRDAILAGIDSWNVIDMIEAGHIVHDLCEKVVKDCQINIRNRYIEEKEASQTQKLKEKELLAERIKERGKELKLKIEAYKKAKEEAEQIEGPQKLAQQAQEEARLKKIAELKERELRAKANILREWKNKKDEEEKKQAELAEETKSMTEAARKEQYAEFRKKERQRMMQEFEKKRS
mmetsp:Transcript_1654/g.3559  ORF Transcript_1654/g.3559 Transcript_1654/m.3559 type:complete len:1208 (+) Transcript_1654:686-4309(+)